MPKDRCSTHLTDAAPRSANHRGIRTWLHVVLCSAGGLLFGLPNALATTVDFPGLGITSAMVPGCGNPAAKADWIDQQADRIGRRVLPRDCVRSLDNPPVFSWTDVPPPARSGDYTLRVDRRDPVTLRWRPFLTATSARPRTLPASPFPTGYAYQWRVEYNQGTVASKWRSFQIDAAALPSNLPSGADAFNRASTRPHPRLLPANTSWGDIWASAQASDLKTASVNLLVDGYWFAISRDSNGNDPTPIPAEPMLRQRADFPSDTAFLAYQADVERAASDAAAILRTMAFASQFAPYGGAYAAHQASFLADARARLMALTRWTNGSTSHQNADQANRNIYLAQAVAFDLLYSQLSEAERTEVATSIRQRIATPLSWLPSFDSIPYRSHEANTLLFTMRALALTAGESPIEPASFADTYDALTTLSSVWGEYDGGSGNGIGYAWTDFLAVPETMFILDMVCDADLGSRAWFARAVDNLIAMSPPGQAGPAAFGDHAMTSTTDFAAYAHHAVRLHAALVPRATSEWYWRQSASQLRTDDLPIHMLALGLHRSAPPPVEPPATFISADAGHVAFHSDAGNVSGTGSSVYFRSSRFGAWNHSHADQNSFVFYSKGVPLLIDAGYYDYYGSPHHLAVTRATRYKNAVTFDGGVGQAQDAQTGLPAFSMNPFGVLLNAGDTGPIAVATGDASKAYQRLDSATNQWAPLLTTALRSMAFHKEQGVLLVYDYLKSATPRTWEWNFQTGNSLIANGQTVTVPNGAATACISLAGATAAFSQATGFAPDPLPSKPYAVQTRGRFVQANASASARTVTVIREDCSTPMPRIDFSGTDALVTFADGRTVTFKQKAVSVSF